MSNFFEEEIKIEGKDTKEQLQSFVKEYENLLAFKGFDFSESQKLKDALDYFGPTPPIELIEAVLKHYNKKKTDLLINKVPDLMRELGISEMTMEDGTRVKLNNEVNVSNTNKPAMCRWLKEHGHGNDVKNILQFSKGEYSEEIEKILRWSIGFFRKDNNGLKATLGYKSGEGRISVKGNEIPNPIQCFKVEIR